MTKSTLKKFGKMIVAGALLSGLMGSPNMSKAGEVINFVVASEQLQAIRLETPRVHAELVEAMKHENWLAILETNIRDQLTDMQQQLAAADKFSGLKTEIKAKQVELARVDQERIAIFNSMKSLGNPTTYEHQEKLKMYQREHEFRLTLRRKLNRQLTGMQQQLAAADKFSGLKAEIKAKQVELAMVDQERIAIFNSMKSFICLRRAINVNMVTFSRRGAQLPVDSAVYRAIPS